jgi:hypothetical protein
MNSQEDGLTEVPQQKKTPICQNRLFRTGAVRVEISVDNSMPEFFSFNSYPFQIKSAIP